MPDLSEFLVIWRAICLFTRLGSDIFHRKTAAFCNKFSLEDIFAELTNLLVIADVTTRHKVQSDFVVDKVTLR